MVKFNRRRCSYAIDNQTACIAGRFFHSLDEHRANQFRVGDTAVYHFDLVDGRRWARHTCWRYRPSPLKAVKRRVWWGGG